jgi:hydrogenase-4 component B
MIWLIAGITLTAFSGVPGLFMRRDGNGGELLACILIVTGTLTSLVAVIGALINDNLSVSLAWCVPKGAIALHIDAIAAAFLLPLFLVVATGAIYGLSYWPQRAHPANGRKLRLFYGLISAAMILLLTAENGVLFLVGWEIMALSGFFLITTEDHKEEVRRAGYIYLIATHSGTLALFGVFALLDHATGSLMYPAAYSLSASGATIIFLLALFGFGMKAGLIPLHIWLPGAHAAAPSHASALLSGVMIKTGIYGLVRLTSFFTFIPSWWGWTILTLGIISGIMGVALAIAQHDIKRLLAYHSVENIGIIAMGLGLALLGRSYDMPLMVALGIAGCLLHVINHGLFKSLLFLSAGSIIHAVGSRDIDHFGGLLKRQPWTGALFLGGAVAICALPPFNGFISEWLIYLGAFQPLKQPHSAVALSILAAPALALIGGLALACFVKVFGITFLGTPRTAEAAQAHEASPLMLVPAAVLLVACAWIGLFPTTLASLFNGSIAAWAPNTTAPNLLGSKVAPLGLISLIGWALVALVSILTFWIYRRSQNSPHTSPTWGCGYSFATARMQYTASSFGDFLVQLFSFGLRTTEHREKISGGAPNKTAYSSHTPDIVLDGFLVPLFGITAWLCRRLRTTIQNGVTAIYLLYSVITILILLTLFLF